MAFNDDAPKQGCSTELLSRLQLTLPAGEYYIGVTGFNATFEDDFFVSFRIRFTSGSYQLRVGNAGNAVGSVEDGEVALVKFTILEAGDCPPDLNGDGLLNFFDLAAYLALFNAGDAAADLAAPFGVLNFFDLAQYLASYNAGCP